MYRIFILWLYIRIVQ